MKSKYYHRLTQFVISNNKWILYMYLTYSKVNTENSVYTSKL